MNREFLYKNLLVIGNGFDLNLGLPTTYNNFVESDIWKRMYEKRSKEKEIPSLIDFLYGKKLMERWFDIEAALLDYVSPKADGSFVNTPDVDKVDYELVCKALADYLLNLFKKGSDVNKKLKAMEETPAGKLLKEYYKYSDSILYSFNYTPLKLIIKWIAVVTSLKNEPNRLHGAIQEESIWNENIKDHPIILGIETDSLNKIAPGYSFLLKSNNPIYKSSKISFDLQNTQNVIFFGHSLNKMDFYYFEEYFKMLTNNKSENRTLCFITKNKKSRINILDNIRISGISIPHIFMHTTVDFILTDNLSDCNSEDYKKFETLFNRL